MPYTRLNYEHLDYTKYPPLPKEEPVVFGELDIIPKANSLENIVFKVRNDETTKEELVEVLADILVEGFGIEPTASVFPNII